MRPLLEFFFSTALLIESSWATRNSRRFPRSLNASDVHLSFSTGHPAPSSHNATSLSIDGSCGDIWMSWLNSSTRYVPTWTSYLDTYTYHNITAATTTLCDGHPRVAGGSGGLTTVATGTNSTLTSAPKNFTLPTPTCRLSPSECTGELATYSLCSGGPTTTPSDCGACSIWGGTVQLNYFPITCNAARNLCQTRGDGSPTLCPLAPTGTPYSVANPFGMTPCDYITDNVTSTRNTGSYLISDGQTFYQNRVYISLDTIYASNSCGYVGKQYAGTTLTLASKDVYSVHGYHHEFNDIGYQFDFADLSSVPADKYYANCGGGQDPICVYSGTNYRYGTDFINGRSDIDFGVGYAVGDGHTETGYQWIWQGAYSPTLLVPLQIRTLDPAWATCSLNLVGFYDPPKPITGQLTYPTPTTPTVPKTSEAAPAATATNDGAPATADPKPTSYEQSTAQYTSTTYTYNPSPTSTAGASADSPDNEGAKPTSSPLGTPQETQQETNNPAPAPTDGSVPDSSPESAGPLDPQSPVESPPPLSGGSPPSDPGSPVLSTPPSPVNTQPLDPESPAPSPPQPIATNDSAPAQSPQDADPQPNTDMPGGAPAASTTEAIGGVIASIFGAQPEPIATTNALSVLESATQPYDAGHGTPTAPAPQGQPEPSSSVPTNDPQTQPPQPITLSDGEQTHTLEPSTESGMQGLYTIATPDPTEMAPGAESASRQPDTLPTQPIILTSDSHTQTVQPVQGSSGLYTIIGPGTTSPAFTYPAPTTGSSLEPEDSEPAQPSQFVVTGPATFVAGGQTHTIRRLKSSSGVFVVDGSRTLTQLAPSSTADSAGSGDSGSTGSAGSGTSSNDRARSTVASASGSLPAVVTATNDSPSSSSTAAGGGGGGNGNADVTVLTPPESGAQGLHVVSCVLAWALAFQIVLYI